MVSRIFNDVEIRELNRRALQRTEQLRAQEDADILAARQQLDALSQVQGQRIESPDARLAQINRSQDFFGQLTPISTGAALTAGVLAAKGEQVGKQVDAASVISQRVKDAQQNLQNQVAVTQLGQQAIQTQEASIARGMNYDVALQNVDISKQAESRLGAESALRNQAQNLANAEQSGTSEKRIKAINTGFDVDIATGEAALEPRGDDGESNIDRAADTTAQTLDAQAAQAGVTKDEAEQKQQFYDKNPEIVNNALLASHNLVINQAESVRLANENNKDKDSKEHIDNKVKSAEQFNKEVSEGKIVSGDFYAAEAYLNSGLNGFDSDKINKEFGTGSKSTYNKALRIFNNLDIDLDEVGDSILGRTSSDGFVLSSPQEIVNLQTYIAPLVQQARQIEDTISKTTSILSDGETTPAAGLGRGSIESAKIKEAEAKQAALDSINKVYGKINEIANNYSQITGIDEKILQRAIIGDDEALAQVNELWFTAPPKQESTNDKQQ